MVTNYQVMVTATEQIIQILHTQLPALHLLGIYFLSFSYNIIVHENIFASYNWTEPARLVYFQVLFAVPNNQIKNLSFICLNHLDYTLARYIGFKIFVCQANSLIDHVLF